MIKTYTLAQDKIDALDAQISGLLGKPPGTLPRILEKHKALVAGSALVALLGTLSFTPNDVDIWVDASGGAALLTALLAWTGAAVSPKSTQLFTADYGRLGRDVCMIITLDTKVPLQIICVRRLTRALQAFDINICSVGWMGKKLWVGQEDAMACLRARQMKLNEPAFREASPEEQYRILMRLKKYGARGFGLQNKEWLQQMDPAAVPKPRQSGTQNEAESRPSGATRARTSVAPGLPTHTPNTPSALHGQSPEH